MLNEHPGARRSIETAGTVAAPLLAGFSFTLLVLLLPSLGNDETTVTVGKVGSVSRTHDAFTGAPEVAAALLLVAGLALVACVQGAMTARRYAHSPAALAEWYPEYFPVVSGGTEPAKAERPSGWTFRGWQPKRVGDQWYAGWTRWFVYTELATGKRWMAWTRYLYHVGIVALLGGVEAMMIPPSGEASVGRTFLMVIAGLGVLAEVTWIGYNSKWAEDYRKRDKG